MGNAVYLKQWRHRTHINGGNLRHDTIGTQRRVRALLAAGWTYSDQARAAGVNLDHLRRIGVGERPTINPRTRDAIAAAYDRLSVTTPPPSRYATAARNHAARKGWPPPGAWDDDTIDQPDTEPGELYQPTSRRTSVETADEVEHFRFMGDTDETIAGRLGITLDALYQALRRAERTAA